MSLDNALRVATGGLANINRQMALVSQNVANASTPDYAAEIGTQHSLTGETMGLGVVTGATKRAIDTALQAEVFRLGSAVSGLGTTATALSSIDAALGTPGTGDDLPSLLGDLKDQFSSLLGSPENQTQQTRVVATAAKLAQGINTLSLAYAGQRQAAHGDIIAAVDRLNQDLDSIGKLSNQIVTLKAGERSTADLENQRDAALHRISDLVDVKALVQTSGDMLVVTSAGLALPTRRGADAISLADANLQPGSYYPGGGVPAILIGGQDVTRQMGGGRIGADLVLRDRTLPLFQAELDEFAHTLASRLSAQGLTLFTDPNGDIPANTGATPQVGYVGFATTIQVNPTVVATPSLIRDGTNSVTDDPDGASAFTPNPSGGPSGFTTLIGRVLDFGFGAESRIGVDQPDPATSLLGPAGNLAAPYAPPPTLADLATALVSAQAQESGATTSSLETEQTLRDSLAKRLSAGSGVDLDTEMAQMLSLQTAYSANARVMTVIQALFTEIMNTVR